MAKSIGSIEVITGTGTLSNSQSETKPLTSDLKLYENDVLHTDENSNIIIKLTDGSTISLGANKLLTLDDSVISSAPYSDDETQLETQSLQAALDEVTELTEIDETAAGEESPQSSASLSMETIMAHNHNTGHAHASTLDVFNSNSLETSATNNDGILPVFDRQEAFIGINDILTKDNTPIITGTTNDPDVIISTTIGGKEYTATNNGDGTWSVEIDTLLNDGENIITVVATDPAGNTTQETAVITVDTTPPSITLDTTLTNDTTPPLSGSTNDGDASIVVNVNGVDYPATITSDGNGGFNWSILDDVVTQLPEGENLVTLTATDPVGNSNTIQDTLTIKTTITDDDNSNGGNVVTIDSITDDTGSSDSDYITNDNTLLVQGTYDNQSDNTLSITVNGTSYDATINGNNWEVNLQNTILNDGAHDIIATITDTLGNSVSTSQTITIDTNHSNTGDATISLDTISGDNVINKTEAETSSVVISGTTTAADGAIVSILVANSLLANVTVTNGVYSYPVTAGIFSSYSDGDYTVTVEVASDSAGNIASASQNVTLDSHLNGTDVNNGNIVTIDSITEDTGSSDSDYITNDNTLLVQGTYDNSGGNTLEVTIAGKTYFPTVNGTTWEVTLDPLTDGENTLSVALSDAAGNTETITQTITIDTNNSNTGDATISLDTISGDNVINKTEAETSSVVISGTTTAADGAIVSILVANSLLANVTVTNGVYSYPVTAGIFSSYSDGDYTVTVEVASDSAGNIASASQNVTLDSHLNGTDVNNGNIVTIDSITEDTGSSDSDYITNDNTLLVQGTYDNSGGNTLEVTIAGKTYFPTVNGTTWEVTLDPLTDGDNTLSVVLSDTAGNTETITKNITIDTKADTDDGTGSGSTVDATITLNNISDDNYLNANEAGNILTLNGTSNVIGAEVLITLNDNSFTTATVAANGTYNVNVSTTQIAAFPDGEYTVTATIVTDTSGNSVSDTKVVTLDTTLDSGSDYTGANITIDAISEDTGSDDFITADSTLIITGTFNSEDENSLTLKLDSTVYNISSTELTTSGNTWSLNLENITLEQGQYTVTASIKDTAGNYEVATQNIQIVDSTDLGVINLNEISDNFINFEEATSNLEITGVSTEIGEIVSFKLNDSPLAINGTPVTAVVTANGTFSISIPADTFVSYTDGVYNLKATVTATNGTIYSDTENVTLDRSNSNVIDEGTGTGDNGHDATITLSTVGDGFINSDEATSGLRVSGTTTAVEGTVISFVTSTGEVITQNSNGNAIVAKADGTYDTYIIINTLTDNSSLSITAQVVADKAGNLTDSNTQTTTVDLSVGTLNTDTPASPVHESGLSTGTATSSSSVTTSGNILTNDSDIGNSTISSFSANGQEATVLSENSNILTLTTSSGTLFIATADTVHDGVNYTAGDYTYVLQNASDALSDDFEYTLEDTAGNSNSSTLSISITDDVVMENGVVDKYLSSDTSNYSTNLILTLDVSGSMNWDAEGDAPGDGHYSGYFWNREWINDYDPSTNRLALAKEALQNLIDKYAEIGDVNIQVITFSGTSTASNMLNAADAKAYIHSLTADGGTMYDTAIAKAEQNPLNAYPDANTTQYYFISDGVPNSGGGLTSTEQIAWNNYVTNSPIDKTYAIGVGNDVNLGELEKIGNDNGETLIINSITDLNSTLISTVNTTIITGELTSFDPDGVAINLGADGGQITQLSLYDQAGNITQIVNYDVNNPSQSITTSLGGTLKVNFDDGSYTYTIDYKDNVAGLEERIDVSATDDDGVSQTNSIYIHLQTTQDENLAYDANGVDGGDGFDTLILSGSQTLDFDSISNIGNIGAIDMGTGDNTIKNLDVNDIIGMTDTDNELFIYGEAQDNITLDAALSKDNTTIIDADGKTFDVYSDVNNTVTLNIEQEIVVS
ncbi:Ig-like domain-containing protein [uncultured Sulfurimonas sp.]|uniref:Ig-like domain-containing protein n=2 Tax=Sulfurimonas TaxID=202746 RepID=UPI0032B23652